MGKKLIMIEINEFNRELLASTAQMFGYKHIKRMLSMKHCKTESIDREEFNGLDPWVQWVSVHTGVPSSIHKIRRVGEVPNLRIPQVWEKLGEKGISTGIWGAMNASRNRTKGNHFFFPDPWTFSEIAYPIELNSFLKLPRYYGKTYLSTSRRKIAFKSLELFFFLFSRLISKELFEGLVRSVKVILQNGINDSILFSLFDVFSTISFLKYKKSFNPQFSLIFLNSLAHNQHSYWDSKKLTGKMKLCIENLDFILGLIFKRIDNREAIIITNGFSQINIHDKGTCIYRQIDPAGFLDSFDLDYSMIEQGMTSDSHVYFKNLNDLEKTYEFIKNSLVNGEELFYVEKSEMKIFYYLKYTKKVDKKTFFTINGEEFEFYKYFKVLGEIERTGCHIASGNLFVRGIEIKQSCKNHEIYHLILNYFNSESNKLKR